MHIRIIYTIYKNDATVNGSLSGVKFQRIFAVRFRLYIKMAYAILSICHFVLQQRTFS